MAPAPTLTIDGKPVEFAPGEVIISAASRAAGKIEIPHYCWHKRLSIAANCRMCLVEVEKAPKLVPACQTECKEGMVVFTKSDKVKAAQRSIHELLLVNHPIDCPICDQAGECKLQDNYMLFQLGQSRVRPEGKVRKSKRTPLGPYVMYDAERCILCTRCVRFMDEVAGERQLGVYARGDRAHIGTFPGAELNHPYSLNVVDVCPVGALTSQVFRFKQRVWNLKRTPSLCGGCARGCNIWVDAREGMVYRLLPRENEAVNKSWLCDEGRLTYARANDSRLSRALMRTASGPAEPCLASTAQKRATELFESLLAEKGRIGAALSLHATNEQAYVFGRIVRDALHAEAVAVLDYPNGTADRLLRVADKNPNRAGVQSVLGSLGIKIVSSEALVQRIESGELRGLLVVGHETSEAGRVASAAAAMLAFVHIGAARSALAERASVTLPSLAWVQSEGTWVNADGVTQSLSPAFAPSGEARPAEEWLQELGAALGLSLGLPNVSAIRAVLERPQPEAR